MRSNVSKHPIKTRTIENDGFCVLHNTLYSKNTIKMPCPELKKDILNKLPNGYVFIDYVYKINNVALSTFHRDVTSSKNIFNTEYPVYTAILYKYTGELLSVCPGSNKTYPFCWSNICNIYGEKGTGVLDYVCAWYIKAAKIIENNKITVGFVSTNSISQGEQVSILWNILFNKYKIKIHFAHRTFKWSNEAKGNAAVHCVIVGFANFDITEKYIFDYEDIQGEPLTIKAKNINPYLVDGSDDTIINNKSVPLSNIPLMRFGSMPRDGGNFIFSEPEKEEFIKIEPQAEKWIRPYTGAKEFINGYSRYCLWLVDISPKELKALPEVLKRVDKVKQFRLESKAASTRKFATTPTLFCQIAQPDTDYLLVPRVSSERRKYIPIGFISQEVIGNDQVLLIPNATLYIFGILTSEMHMTWMKYVCGRLESRFRYSKDIVYNNYPFPENVNDKQKQKVETAAQAVLDTRTKYPDSSLADLYDPLTMPPDLVKAHQILDKAVDLCYRPQPFVNELNRIEFLFNLYEALNAPLLKTEKKKRAKKSN
jgi:hypothetical protein